MKYNKRVFVFYLVLSLVIVVLPLDRFVASVKSVLGYVFIPQIRASHASVSYFKHASQKIRDLLNADAENTRLKTEIVDARLTAQQMVDIMAENERLSLILNLSPQKKWAGVYAHMVYREPNRWNTIIIDKGASDGISGQSAVLGIDNGALGLIGEVIETTDKTSKVILINDPEFSATAVVDGLGVEGLIVGAEKNLKLKFIPLDRDIAPQTQIFTSPKSAIFPQGILIGTVISEEAAVGVRTSKTLLVKPAVDPYTVKEVFALKK